MNKRKILFLTGTRADYGKMKSLMCAIEESDNFECYIFVTGMHTLKEFGSTQLEIVNDNFKNIHVYMNQIIEEPMDLILANTINGFSRYVKELEPDLIVVHGDRVESLAGAITGVMNNIMVAHIEGGEVSGTIDESVRHAISKLAHIHFVSNKGAKERLIQLGERDHSVYIIGSPDIDIIMQGSSIKYSDIKERYNVKFHDYAILMYHPVTTEVGQLSNNIQELVNALISSNDNFIVIQPNNDLGYKIILNEYKRLDSIERFQSYPSIRFEFFLELLKNAKYLIGNSSAGIHEAPVIGLPSVNVGTRQKNRFSHESIINCNDDKESILGAIKKAKGLKNIEKTFYFGKGTSSKNFLEALLSKDLWNISKQKMFVDV